MALKIASTRAECLEDRTQATLTHHGRGSNRPRYSDLTAKPSVPSDFFSCPGDGGGAASVASYASAMQCYQCSQCSQCYQCYSSPDGYYSRG